MRRKKAYRSERLYTSLSTIMGVGIGLPKGCAGVQFVFSNRRDAYAWCGTERRLEEVELDPGAVQIRLKFNPDNAKRGLCVNGCNYPVQYPSKVLCQECLNKLSAKIEKILENLKRKNDVQV
jgi:hypothetical protein